MAEEIKVVIQVATAGGKAKIKDFTQTGEKEFKGLLGSAKKYLGPLGVAGLVATAAGTVVAGFRRMIDKGSEFQQQQADLQAITGIAGDRLKYLGDQALKNSVKYGESASNIIEAQKLVASKLADKIDFDTQAGTEQLAEISRQAIVLQKAAGTDLATAVNATTTALNQFNLPAQDTARIINSIAAGSKFGAAEAASQAQAYAQAGSVFAAANIQFETLNASTQILAQNAIEGARAGTGLRNVVTILQSEAKKLADHGIKDVNVQTDGFVASLEKLKPLLGDTAALADIFGRENLTVAQILIKNADALGDMEQKVTDTNVAQEQAAVQLDTYKGAMSQLSAAIDSQLIPAFQRQNGVMVKGIQTMTNWITATSHAIDVISDWLDESSDFRREQQLNTQVTQQRIQGIVNMINAQKKEIASETASAESKEKARKVLELYVQNLEKEKKRLEENDKKYAGNIETLKKMRANLEETGRFGVKNYFKKLDELNQAIDRNTILQAENSKQLQFYNTVAPQAATTTNEQKEASADAAVATGRYAAELDRVRASLNQMPSASAIFDPLSGAQLTAPGIDFTQIGSADYFKRQISSIESEIGQTAPGEKLDKLRETLKGLKADLEGVQHVTENTGIAWDQVAQSTGQAAAQQILYAKTARGAIKGIIQAIEAQIIAKAILAAFTPPTPLSLALAPILAAGATKLINSLIPGFATGGSPGGYVSGPGTTTSDSILARISDREFVMNAASASAMPDVLRSANKNPQVAAGLNSLYKNLPRFSEPNSSAPNLSAIDRVVQVSNSANGAGQAILLEELKKITETLKNLDFRPVLSLTEFNERYDNDFKTKEFEVGR